MEREITFKGGFPLEYFNGGADKRILCSQCHLVLRNPMQATCGHRFCVTCVDHLRNLRASFTCPQCEEEGNEETEVSEVYCDNAMRKEMSQIKVVCLHKGCKNDKLIYSQLDSHIDTCDYRLVRCPIECGVMIAFCQVEHHKENDCKLRRTKCQHCSTEVTAKDLQAHYNNNCKHFYKQCQSCGKTFSQSGFNQHDCPYGWTPERGCPFKCKLATGRKPLMDHKMGDHLKNVASGVKPTVIPTVLKSASGGDDGMTVGDSGTSNQAGRKKQFSGSGAEGYTVQVLKSSDYEPMLVDDVHVSEEALLKHRHEAVTDHADQLNARVRDLERGGVPSRPRERSDRSYDRRLEEREMERYYMMERGMRRGYREPHPMDSHFNSLMEEELQRAKSILDDLKSKIDQADRDNKVKQAKIEQLQLEILENARTNFEGVLVWPINNFSTKITEAKAGRQKSIYSPAFYTGKFGYKLCMRLYPNGDDQAWGRYMSLYLVIMKGQYDAVLRWPFRQKVTMILIDQNFKENIVDAFEPPEESQSFQRPRSEMNSGSGNPTFVPLTYIPGENGKAYVKDDTMFIKVVIDCSSLTHP